MLLSILDKAVMVCSSVECVKTNLVIRAVSSVGAPLQRVSLQYESTRRGSIGGCASFLHSDALELIFDCTRPFFTIGFPL